MTMLLTNPFPASIPGVPATTEVNFTSYPATTNTGQVSVVYSPGLPTRGKQNYKRHLYSRPKTCPVKTRSYAQATRRVLLSEPGLDLELELEETPLTECRKCQKVATYFDLCYFHWQEHVSYSIFQPDVTDAIAAFNLAGSSF